MIPSLSSSRPSLEEFKEPAPAQPQNLKQKVTESDFFFDDRETRSTIYQAGPMTFEHYDEKTGVVTFRFDSRKDYEKLNQSVASQMAHYGNYAIARPMAERAQSMRSVPHWIWLNKALEATAKQAQDEKYGEISANYRFHASKVAAIGAREEKVYKEAIRQLKIFFRPPQQKLEIYFEHLREAKRLKPNSFEPFYFALFFSLAIVENCPEIFEEVLKDAYAVSAIQTFNCVMIHLKLIPSEEKIKTILTLFQRCFPSDVFLAMWIHDFTTRTQKIIVNNSEQLVIDLRKQFSQHLANALNFVRAGDLTSARDEFSRASHCHISDRRPYMYRALIDLAAGDSLSALKQITDLARTIRMHDQAHYRQAINEFFDYFLNEERTTIKFDSPPESDVLKSLLPIFRSDTVQPELLKTFHSKMEAYLQHEEADPFWAQFAMDLLLEHSGEMQNKLEVFLSLYGLVSTFLYFRLSSAEENLAEFERFFTQDSEGLYIHFNLVIQSPSLKPTSICIDPMSFEISEETKVPFLKCLLMQTYAQWGSLLFRIGGSLDEWEKVILQDNSHEFGPMETSFISALLDRYGAEGNEEQKTKLIDWACRHFQIYPESKREDFTRLVLRWQLNQPIPCIGRETLADAASRWLSLVGEESYSDRPLGIALQVWTFIHREAFKEASDHLALFFENWKDFLSEEIDVAALRALCLARVLLRDLDFIQSKIFSSLSGRELELADAALSMIAREGVVTPYVIPKQRMSKEMGQELYRLYLGQKRGESDLDYKKRLDQSKIFDLSDIRHSKRFKEFEEEKSLEPGPSWVIPTLKVHAAQKVRQIIEDTIKRHQLRMEKNREIAKEAPEYSTNPEFINWVTNQKNLVSEYGKASRKVEEEIDRKFPRFSGRKELIDELKEKAKHEEAVKTLKQETPPAEKTPGKRFWQLIHQIAQLIETVTSSQRSEESFDLFMMSEEEARFVMQLIYEWGLKAWGDRDIRTFAGAFHGPETHIWGKGPRIPHFNAGIYIAGKGKPINIHIFYQT